MQQLFKDWAFHPVAFLFRYPAQKPLSSCISELLESRVPIVNHFLETILRIADFLFLLLGD